MSTAAHVQPSQPTTGPRRPIAVIAYAWTLPLAAALFAAALVTDLIYANSGNSQWVTFSVWLITFAMLTAVVVVLAGIGALLSGAWRSPAMRLHGVVVASALLVGLVNAFVHSRDGLTAVVPTGLSLSAITVLLLGTAAVLTRARSGRFPE